jgi:hypothetical protein
MDRYLVLQLARFGDLLQSKRLLLTLAARGETHLALDASLAPLARLLYPRIQLHSVKSHAGGLSPQEVMRLNAHACAELASLDFTAVCCLNRSPLALALSGLFPPEIVRGYRLNRGQALHSTWCRMAARWTQKRRCSPINLMDFWAFFHPDPLDPGRVNPVASARNKAGAGQRIGVALSGREARRSLPVPALARILEALFTARKGPFFILLGGESEREGARLLLRQLPPAAARRCTDLSGRTALSDLPEIVGGLELLFKPDTGLMHLAAHLGTPVAAVFLSSAWAWETGPYGLGHLVWQAAPECAPCLESAPCPRQNVCLAPFRSEDWLRHLAGRPGHLWPSRMLGLASGFDDLGLTFTRVDGEEPPELTEERRAGRALLAEYLGLGGSGSIPPEAAAELFAENDWMLPELLPGE